MLKIQENVALAKRTTFEIGGAARYFADALSDEAVQEAVLWARSNKVPHVILGGGSNVLIPDDGLEALVIHIASSQWSMTGGTLQSDAGCNLHQLIRKTNVLGFGGWEKLAGIPGTIGGAIRGNAGAFGSEIKDFVTKVKALNVHTLQTKEFSSQECQFSYRNSFFKAHAEWIVLSTTLQLQKGDAQKFLHDSEETIAERERRHIQNVRAAGSYFVNPVAPHMTRVLFEKEKNVQSREGRVPAGWLIEKSGMKGAIVGGAQSSLQHADYLVNTGHATAKDVKSLAQKIKAAVKAQFGIDLKEEAALF